MDRYRDRFRIIFIIIYFLSLFFLGSLFVMMFGAILASSNGISVSAVINVIIGNKNYTPSLEEENIALAAQGFGNALTYLIMFISAIIFMRKDFKDDFILFKSNKKFYIIYTIVAVIIFTGLAYLISYLINLAVDVSENQKTIESIMKTSAMVPMIISTAIFAPVVEELIYRKCVFHYTRSFKIYFGYILSIVLFTLPHIFSSIGKFSVGTFFLMMIPYVIDAFMLALIYHKGKFNIYTTILCHMMNNILAIILLFV